MYSVWGKSYPVFTVLKSFDKMTCGFKFEVQLPKADVAYRFLDEKFADGKEIHNILLKKVTKEKTFRKRSCRTH
ncbi:hypothetical protein SAMN05421863_100125 [Nitrosomonas communis]|uniref:Uncharacterized protein n=1 Tax=Nitrosomonas communis TaxID=44574 RepID=A0A1I4IQZ5_9PROT|nr:hypothetical protein SAMN05421863_100125 [Nitrosomonas communis]